MDRTGVFISHAHEDRDLAESLTALLRTAFDLSAADITCTSDAEYSLQRGSDLNKQISARLSTAKALFLVATPASRVREWVQYECATADKDRENGLLFYIVTPFAEHVHAVPSPYVGRVAVTLSQAEDLHEFVKQLRRDFQQTAVIDYCDQLIDVIDRSTRLEQVRQYEVHRARVAQEGAEGLRVRKHRFALAALTGVLLLVAITSLAWGLKRERDHAAEIARKDEELSERVNAVQLASDAEFKQFAFTGLLQDGRRRYVPCSRVEANLRDTTATGGERRVGPKDCDGSGAFAFSAPELQNDARQPISLKVHVGQRSYDLIVRLAEARLALPIVEGK
jgi:hypothetical protein